MSRRLYAPALLALAAAMLVAGCGVSVFNDSNSNTTIGSAPYVQGSGNSTTETRNLDTFHAVSVENGLTVFVVRGDKASAAVTADDNLVPMIVTTVEGGTLRIYVDGSLSTKHPLAVTVTATALVDSIDQGSGSTVDFQSVAGDSLTVSVDSGSTLRAGGRVTNLDVTVSSGSTADLRNVEAQTAQVDVSSGSTARLLVKQSVTGSCSSGSTLRVAGGASVSAVQSSSGSTVAQD